MNFLRAKNSRKRKIKTSTQRSNFELVFCRHLTKNTSRGSGKFRGKPTTFRFILIFRPKRAKIAIFFQRSTHQRDKSCSQKIQACLGHHEGLPQEILANLHAGFVNYEFLSVKTSRRHDIRASRPRIRVLSWFFAGISIKIHAEDLPSFVENRQRLDLF